MKENYKEKIEDIFKRYRQEDILIYAHADHDGICAAVGINYLFGDIETRFSQSFRPLTLPPLNNKKLLVVCDLLLTSKQVYKCLENGVEVINFDHHDVLDIHSDKYLCLNPKKIYGKEFISSSGLIWKLFKPKNIAWILGVGSVGDITIEDVPDLFAFIQKQHPELIKGLDAELIYDSKIFELAQILLLSFDNPEVGFNLVKESLHKGYKIFYQSSLYSSYLEKQKSIESFLAMNIKKFVQNRFFIAIDSSNQKYPGSYSVKLNLMNKDDRVYIEYSNGRMFFRNYFGKEDVRNLAKLFNGYGAHCRSGGGFTKKSFEKVIGIINNYFNRKAQKKLM